MDRSTTATSILIVHYGGEWIRGSERCLLDLLAYINRKKYRPVVWCNSQCFAKEVENLGIETITTSFPILLGWLAPRFNGLAYLKLLSVGSHLIKKYNIKLIHVNSGAPNQWMVPLSRFYQIPILAHLHARYGLRERCTLLLHQPTRIIGVSKPVIAGLLGDNVPASRCHIISNAVDSSRLSAALPVNLRQTLNIPMQSVLLLSVGSLIYRKGFDLLLKALKKVRSTGLNTHLIIIGDGPESDSLKAYAKSLSIDRYSYFMGEIPNIGGHLLGSGADLFVSGAREEVFGLVLAEAGLAGLPVIAPRVGGISEVVRDGESGILVEAENSDAIAQAIISLANSKNRRAHMGALAKKHIEEHFNIARYIDDFEKNYAELLSGEIYRDSLFSRWYGSSEIYAWAIDTVRRKCSKAVKSMVKHIVTRIKLTKFHKLVVRGDR